MVDAKAAEVVEAEVVEAEVGEEARTAGGGGLDPVRANGAPHLCVEISGRIARRAPAAIRSRAGTRCASSCSPAAAPPAR